MQTNRATMLKLTAGAVTLAIALTACQSRQPVAELNAAIGAAADEARPAAVLVAQAEAARAVGNPVAAVSFAELAVTADSQNAAARSALAKAYQSAGRFRSAADAYGDIVAMNPQDSYSRFRAALVTLAAGDRRAALTALDGLATTPALAADVGLALALAGETDRAVDLLVKTVRSGDSTPRVRQNLALAQALAGEWAAARVSASIDLSPDLVDARVAEWAALASNKDSAWRTATVLGVGAAVSDAGRPVQLAWAAPQPATTQFAEATVVEQVAIVEPAPVPVVVAKSERAPAPVVVAKTEPLVRPEPVKITKVELPALPKPLVFDGVPSKKPEAEPAKPVQVIKVTAAAPALRPIVAVKREIRALPKPTSGAWVVQLGSYAKPEFLTVGWQGLVQKKKALGDYKPMKSSIDVDGKAYYRLSVGRFATSAEAGELCKSLKSEGYKCFVRKGEGAATPTTEPKRA